MRFEGVVPAVLTPFDEDGEVDTGALARNVEWLLENGATGLVGEGPGLFAPSCPLAKPVFPPIGKVRLQFSSLTLLQPFFEVSAPCW
jgi:hypothetical protein